MARNKSSSVDKGRIESIAVLGLGAVGELAATLLHEAGFAVTGVDTQLPDRPLAFACTQASATVRNELAAVLSGCDAVLSCLPYHLNKDVARLACELGLFYFDLTEDVATKELILDLAKTSDKLMAPQCGLANGFVGIVGANLAENFEEIRSIKLRVGALPQHPTGLLAYSFNWSTEGVVNEYLNDCEVIEDGKHKSRPWSGWKPST
ncbi:MAG: saccharopine dehydrogenase C-terminal domain-containing protein [Pseudomonadales bacterium]